MYQGKTPPVFPDLGIDTDLYTLGQMQSGVRLLSFLIQVLVRAHKAISLFSIAI